MLSSQNLFYICPGRYGRLHVRRSARQIRRPVLESSRPSYEYVAIASRVSSNTPSWFKCHEIPLPHWVAATVDSSHACLFLSMELYPTSKQFENALIMKFSSGLPSLHDIEVHIKHNWNLSCAHVVSLRIRGMS